MFLGMPGSGNFFSRSGIPTPSSRGTSLNCELYARSISRQINKPGCPSHPGSAASADEDPDDSDESSSEVSDDDDDDELSDAEGGESEEGVASDTELPNDAFMCVSHAALLLRLQSTPPHMKAEDTKKPEEAGAAKDTKKPKEAGLFVKAPEDTKKPKEAGLCVKAPEDTKKPQGSRSSCEGR